MMQETIPVNLQMQSKPRFRFLYLKVSIYIACIFWLLDLHYIVLKISSKVSEKYKFYFLDRQSEPLLRPDAKDHSSSIFHQKDTHLQRSDSNSNHGENNLESAYENGKGFPSDITSSSSSSLLLLPWFEKIHFKLSLVGYIVSFCLV